MDGAGAGSVMRRKLAAGRRSDETFVMTTEKALGQALTRAAQDLLSMPLRILRLQETRVTLADMPELLEDRSLLALLHGPGEGTGVLAISPPMLSALIEMRTIGRLAVQPPAPRRPTRTDAAMVADFVDVTLGALEEALSGTAELIWAGGFRYSSFLDDPRPLPLMLEDAAYRSFRFELDLGPSGQARPGSCLLVLPAEGRGRALAVERVTGELPGPAQAEARADWARRLEAAVLEAPGALNGVLARVTLPLGRVLSLAPGQTVELPSGALEAARVEGPGGRLVARARLGRQQGQRALRLDFGPEGGGGSGGGLGGGADPAELVPAPDEDVFPPWSDPGEA
ncbi:FliM/FliN family flagellar motor switch protein [Frigidibacter sp. MR17.14]|uniref:FliM/FliN family flagellar motor switch protein n=1 Tax=Frigidibacter sp. MR17.14 TaxID=3126509 RepID=UPI003012B4CB